MGEPSLSIKKAPELPHKGKSLHFQPVYEPGVTILDKTYSSAQGTGEITCRVRLLWGIGRYFRPKTGVWDWTGRYLAAKMPTIVGSQRFSRGRLDTPQARKGTTPVGTVAPGHPRLRAYQGWKWQGIPWVCYCIEHLRRGCSGCGAALSPAIGAGSARNSECTSGGHSGSSQSGTCPSCSSAAHNTRWGLSPAGAQILSPALERSERTPIPSKETSFYGVKSFSYRPSVPNPAISVC